MDLVSIVDEIKEKLDEKDRIREKVLVTTREVVRCCRESINRLHRKDFVVAEERLGNAETNVKNLRALLNEHPDIYYSGSIQTANQEFAEALLFYDYLKKLEFPSPDDLEIPDIDYLLGLCDLVGELRRHVLLLLMDENPEEAKNTYRFMEGLYEEVMSAEYPRGLINIKQKQDAMRFVVERTLEDLTRAKLTKELETKIENILGKKEKGASQK